jgi:murein DD-endopeptidase MepM/ murein hydrolase activator NlpD
MRKRQYLIAVAITAVFIAPYQGQAASSIDEINQKIAQIKQEQNSAESRVASVDGQIRTIQSQKNQVQQDLASLDTKLNQTQQRIEKLDLQIGDSTLRAQDAAVQLDKAVKRVQERDQLLKTRVKIMYEMGDVSYLDVLFGAKDFGDFLNRLEAIRLIVNSDTKILEDNLNDQNTIASKKTEIDEQLASLQGLYQEAGQLKAELNQQQKQKTIYMAKLNQQQGQLEDVKKEQEQQLLDLADKMRSTLAQKNRFNSVSRSATYKGGQFAWPVPDSSTISSGFGYRTDPFTGEKAGHDGVDIAAPQGTTIVAAADGVVLVAGSVRGYGNCIIIDHGGNLSTLYGHIRDGGLMVSEGQQVKRGQKIAEVGSTGRSTGPHCHFGVYQGRTPVNPMQYLN